jgi:hypothetical protein
VARGLRAEDAEAVSVSGRGKQFPYLFFFLDKYRDRLVEVEIVCSGKSQISFGSLDFLVVWLRFVGWDPLCLFILVEIKRRSFWLVSTALTK